MVTLGAIVAPVNPSLPSPASGPVALPGWKRYSVLMAEAEYESVKKDTKVAYALWCVVGIFGGHRFYLGDTARSITMLFTFGGLGLWTLLDVFFVGRRVRAVNRSRRSAIMARYGIVEDRSER